MRLDPVLSLLPKHCCPITLALKGKFEAGVVSSGLAAKPSSGEFNLCFRSRDQLWSFFFYLFKSTWTWGPRGGSAT